MSSSEWPGQNKYFTRSYQPTGQETDAMSGPGSFFRKNANTNYKQQLNTTTGKYDVYSQRKNETDYAKMNRGYGGRKSKKSRKSRKSKKSRKSRKYRKH